MSKKEKLLKKLTAVPAPNDFRWQELVSLMRWAGFKEHCSGGSHYTFEHTSGIRLQISKTHPSGLLKGYQIRDVKEMLTRVNILGD